MKLIPYLIPFLLLTVCCKKSDTQLNKFKCTVNGNLWRSYNDDRALELEANIKGRLTIKATNTINKEVFIIGTYIINGVLEEGEFVLKGSLERKVSNEIFNDKTGYINIKRVDAIAHRITGSFYFEAVNATTKEVINTTDGEFNVKYTN
ncbi:MAG: hypothetical protein JWQ25_3054 [Daejeonella sp.]|nr:hypothetical protein [Daejeonella sp.]